MTEPSGGEPSNDAVAPCWRLVFCDPEPIDGDSASCRERLFDRVLRLLKPGFRHCFLMRRMTAERGAPSGWLVVNPHAARMDILEVVDDGDGVGGYGAYVDHLARAGRVSVLKVPQRYPATLALRPWFSCVEVVKHVTGLKPPVWVVTPWQLYRWIGRAGIKAA